MKSGSGKKGQAENGWASRTAGAWHGHRQLAGLGRNFMIRGFLDKNQRMAFLPNSYAAASEAATKSAWQALTSS